MKSSSEKYVIGNAFNVWKYFALHYICTHSLILIHFFSYSYTLFYILKHFRTYMRRHFICIANKQSLPEISAGMIRKLRHLTIVSLATNNKQIPYGLLLKELDLHNVRELEVS